LHPGHKPAAVVKAALLKSLLEAADESFANDGTLEEESSGDDGAIET